MKLSKFVIWWPLWIAIILLAGLVDVGTSSTKLRETVVAKDVSCEIIDTYVNNNPGISIKLNCNGTKINVPKSSQVLAILMLAPEQRVGIKCDTIYADSTVDNCAIPKKDDK